MLLPLGERQRMLSCHMISFLLSFALTADISHKCLLYYLPVIVFCVGNSLRNPRPHASKVLRLLHVNLSLSGAPWGPSIHLSILTNSGSLNYTASERPLFRCLGGAGTGSWHKLGLCFCICQVSNLPFWLGVGFFKSCPASNVAWPHISARILVLIFSVAFKQKQHSVTSLPLSAC